MSKNIYGVSPTSVIIRCKLMDSTVSTGAGKTGIAYNTTGLIISTIQINEATATVYSSAGTPSIQNIATLGTYVQPSVAGNCRFREVDATNHPGVYELQFFNARFANTDSLLISISGVTGLAQSDFEVECKNVASNVININGTAQTARDIGASVLLSSGTGAGQLDFTSGVVKSNMVQILATALTETSGYLAAAFKAFFNIASPVLTVASINQTGDSFARLGAPAGASIEADIAAINSKTTNLPASPAAVGSNMGTVSSVTGNVGGSVASVTADVGITQAGADKVWSSTTRTLSAFAFTVSANLTQILGTALTETTGYIAAGFKKFFNVASPVFTTASVNQTADFGTADFNATQKASITTAVPTVTQNQSGMATSATQTTILNAVNAITTNTSRSAPRVPDFMSRPVSGSVAYEVDLYLYSLQGLSEDADSNTINVHARNSSGTSRDSGLSSTTMTRSSIGKYTVQYTVNSTDTAESVYFDFTWAIATVAMKDGAATQVQDAESISTMLAVKAKTDLLTFDGSNNIKSVKNATDAVGTDFSATEKASINTSIWSAYCGDATAENVSYDYIMQLIMAMANGKFVKDVPSLGDITFYKRNNTTPLTVVYVNDVERIRVS